MKFKETIIRVTHVEYWEHMGEERYIQCSDILPNPPPTIRCMQNSIGSYLEVYEEKGKAYIKTQLLFFCKNHTPIIVQKAIDKITTQLHPIVKGKE